MQRRGEQQHPHVVSRRRLEKKGGGGGLHVRPKPHCRRIPGHCHRWRQPQSSFLLPPSLSLPFSLSLSTSFFLLDLVQLPVALGARPWLGCNPAPSHAGGGGHYTLYEDVWPCKVTAALQHLVPSVHGVGRLCLGLGSCASGVWV